MNDIPECLKPFRPLREQRESVSGEPSGVPPSSAILKSGADEAQLPRLTISEPRPQLFRDWQSRTKPARAKPRGSVRATRVPELAPAFPIREAKRRQPHFSLTSSAPLASVEEQLVL